MDNRGTLLGILKHLSYEEGEFVLASGKKSNFYIDCKETTLNPQGMYLVGDLMYAMTREIPGGEPARNVRTLKTRKKKRKKNRISGVSS